MNKEGYCNELSNAVDILEKKGCKLSADVIRRHLKYANGGSLESLSDPDDIAIEMLCKTRDALIEAKMAEEAVKIEKMADDRFKALLKGDETNKPKYREDANLLRELGADNAAEILEKQAVKSRTSPHGAVIENNQPDDLFWKCGQKAFLRKDTEQFNLLEDTVKTRIKNRFQLLTGTGSGSEAGNG